MTQKASFLRLLDTPISEKGNRLRQQITDLNASRTSADVFSLEPTAFSSIPSSPFAYWAGEKISSLFVKLPKFESSERTIKIGLSTSDNFRFLRLWWETESNNQDWIALSKGGIFSKYYSDLHLLLNWQNDGQALKEWVVNNPTDPNTTHWSRRIASSEYYFRAGLTYSLRTTSALSVRVLPSRCIFTHKGPSVFVQEDNQSELLALLAIANSKPFLKLVELQLGAATMAARSYEVGILQRTPLPLLSNETVRVMMNYSLQGYELVRQPYQSDETTHVFCLPAILQTETTNLLKSLSSIEKREEERLYAISLLESQVDSAVAQLYGVAELVDEKEQRIETTLTYNEESSTEEEDDESESTSLLSDPYALASDLLMWSVGVAFGRWDVRYALNPEILPDMPEPFDPLPVCSPGMLKGTDGLPLDEPPRDYPLKIATRGFLVDDPDRPQDDIVNAVRAVIHLLWREQAESVENEACQILGIPDLRSWFRDPKGFFAWHIKRYSKSRRKAPIYWLIQSAKKNYAIWLYYPRLNPDSLFYAAREYADAKYNLENTRLDDMQNQLKTTTGSSRKAQEKKVSFQMALVAELKSYLKELDAAAMLQLKPDLNDGVLLNIAPLRELVPWKEPARIWDELLHGKYAWSRIATELRQKGLIKGS